MPEVGEVAHAVANLRRTVIGLTIKSAKFLFDDKIFPGLKPVPGIKDSLLPQNKNSLKNYVQDLCFDSEDDISKSLLYNKITSVGRHGKYFWIRTTQNIPEKSKGDLFAKGIIVLLHFGMTGWIKFKDMNTHFIQMESGGYKKVFKLLGTDENGIKLPKEENEVNNETNNDVTKEWPPRFHKFVLKLANGSDEVNLGFIDPRRLSKVRFFQNNEFICTDELLMQNIEKLDVLGPDYSKVAQDSIVFSDGTFIKGDPDPSDHGKHILSKNGFLEFIKSKPNLTAKPFLLKQEYFAGIGNWMADEILYHSRIHPEERLGNLSDEGISILYDSILEVSRISVKTEAEVAKFPNDWLMLYRWGKKLKKTYHGHEVKFLTVGGRTSCYIPELQKKKSKRSDKDSIILPNKRLRKD